MKNKEFIYSLSRELNNFIEKRTSISDFIQKFYLLFDEQPQELSEQVYTSLESFNEALSLFEADIHEHHKRKFLDEESIKSKAKELHNFLLKYI